MKNTLFFLAIVITLRVLGAMTRSDNRRTGIRLISWALCLMAAWMMVNIVEGWPRLWPLPALFIMFSGIEFLLKKPEQRFVLWTLGDLIAVFVLGQFSIAPLSLFWLTLAATGFGFLGMLLDWLSQQVSWRLRLATLGTLVIFSCMTVAFRPDLANSGMRLVFNRMQLSATASAVELNTADPVGGLSFTDITEIAGTGGPTEAGQTGGHGVMFADVDSNGRPDLYVTMNWNDPMADLFYRNNNGELFTGVGEEVGLADFDGGSHGACFADLDNDGDYDLFNGTTLTEDDQPANNDVLQNNGSGRFSSVFQSGVELRLPTRAVLCFDIDKDGDLDLVGISNYKGSADPPDEFNEVYRNDGNFRFEPISAGDLSGAPAGQGAIDTDFDNDGDIDIIAANRTGNVNILRNNGKGQFSLLDPESMGVEHHAGDGISTGDVNNDGTLDILLSSDDEGHLYLNNNDGTFSFKASFLNTAGYMGGFADLDNDGDLDLYFAGDTKVYLNDGTGNFSSGPAVPVSDINDPRAVAFADIDYDGDLDFAIGAKRSRNWLVRNDLNLGNWLKLQIVSPKGQAGAFGAKVFIYPTGSDTLLAMRETRSNSGYLAQNEPVLHVGLGSHTLVDVVVKFLDGSTVTRKHVPARQTILVDGRNPESLDRIALQSIPYVEWSLQSPDVTDNPFDLVASVKFVHQETGEAHTTEMFYDGEFGWRFRFTGTQPGQWTFSTSSQNTELDGASGSIWVYPNLSTPGFVTNFGNKWGWTGTNQTFIPQFVMYSAPPEYYNNPIKIDADIQTFFDDHGFNGFHTLVFCRWFDITQEVCRNISESNPNPDPRTFEALELLIRKVHAAGGVVHIWAWGDEQRGQTPKKWGINSEVDRRLQKYIAARLGPLPGWTMGYGFDLDEWVTARQLAAWQDHMRTREGWFHFYGGRPVGPNNGLDHSPYTAWNKPLDYASYEHHKPSYDVYAAALAENPDKPVFSEDRFRIRDEGRAKDYSMDETRRGLWNSAMAGGVANIWGNVLNAPDANIGLSASQPYPEPDQIKTYAKFFQDRFTTDLERCNHLTDGVCLKRAENTAFIFYKQATTSLKIVLPDMAGPWPAVAVDTKLPYEEIEIGNLDPGIQIWTAPYQSDWTVAVGIFQ